MKLNSNTTVEESTKAAIAPIQCYMPFSKEVFVETISKIKQQYEWDKDCSEKLKSVFPNAFKANLMYENHLVMNQIVKLLQVAFNDNHEHSWIEYFLWELNFGEENYRLKATDKDGKNIPLSTAGELYDLLTGIVIKEKNSLTLETGDLIRLKKPLSILANNITLGAKYVVVDIEIDSKGHRKRFAIIDDNNSKKWYHLNTFSRRWECVGNGI